MNVWAGQALKQVHEPTVDLGHQWLHVLYEIFGAAFIIFAALGTVVWVIKALKKTIK